MDSKPPFIHNEIPTPLTVGFDTLNRSGSLSIYPIFLKFVGRVQSNKLLKCFDLNCIHGSM